MSEVFLVGFVSRILELASGWVALGPKIGYFRLREAILGSESSWMDEKWSEFRPPRVDFWS